MAYKLLTCSYEIFSEIGFGIVMISSHTVKPSYHLSTWAQP